MYHSGDSDREPLRNALDQSLYVAGAQAAAATLAALFARLATGQGQRVDVSVVECLATHLVQAVPYYSYMGAIKGRRPVRGSGFEELMPARDGYVVPSVQGSQPWQVVADLIGLEELHDQRFASGAGRIAHGEELKSLLVEGLARWDRKPLFQASGERRLVFGMAQDAATQLQDRLSKIGSAAGLKGAIYGLIIMMFILFEPYGLYGRWLKVKLFFQLFPLYKRATFKRQKTYVKSERNR
jgi:crotonobetainyl-CoA:carnitine CoA-transferase CaiB-like acyl-CoA transferase